jgi:hypothetical protein
MLYLHGWRGRNWKQHISPKCRYLTVAIYSMSRPKTQQSGCYRFMLILPHVKGNYVPKFRYIFCDICYIYIYKTFLLHVTSYTVQWYYLWYRGTIDNSCVKAGVFELGTRKVSLKMV